MKPSKRDQEMAIAAISRIGVNGTQDLAERFAEARREERERIAEMADIWAKDVDEPFHEQALVAKMFAEKVRGLDT